MSVRLNLINQFSIQVGDQVVRRLRTRKTEELLAYLALHATRWCSRTELMDVLWPGDDEQTGRRKLRLALHSIRALIGHHLETDGDLVQVRDVEVDLHTVDLLGLGTGWRLMPEHQVEWLDLMAATSQAQQQIEAVSSLRTEPAAGSRAAHLSYLITVEPQEPSLYEALHDHYLAVGSRVAAAVVAGIARQNLGAGCPARLISTRSPSFRSDFCGRLRELTLLADRLLGPNEPASWQVNGLGGMGKTRLARELAVLAPLEEIPVAELSLSGLRYAEDVVLRAIAETLQLDPEEAAVPQEVSSILLILDNADDLAPGALDFLLPYREEGCGLRALVTCQQRRADAGEPLTLGPLELPQGASLTHAQQSSSVHLLLHHSGQVLTEDNAAAFLTLSAESGGIPLALRMIGSQCRFRSVQEVASELRSIAYQLKFKHEGEAASPRHLSLDAALEWGFVALTHTQQQALLRLSLLEDEFEPSIGAPLAISDEDFNAVREAGWIQFTQEPRLNLLPPVKQFLRERTQEDEAQVRTAIKQFLVDGLAHSYPDDYGRVTRLGETYQADIARLEAETETPSELGPLLIGLQVTAHRYGRVERFLARMQELVERQPVPAWINLLANTHYLQNDHATALPLFHQVLERSEGEMRGVAQCNVALCHLSMGQIDEAVPLLRSSIEATEVPRRRAARVLNLGSALLQTGNLKEARECFDQARELFEGMPEIPGYLGLVHLRTAEAALLSGDTAESSREALLALDTWESLKQWPHLPDTYSVLVLIAAAQGDASGLARWVEQWSGRTPPVTTFCTTLLLAFRWLGQPALADLFLPGASGKQVPLFLKAILAREGLSIGHDRSSRMSRSQAIALARQAMKRL